MTGYLQLMDMSAQEVRKAVGQHYGRVASAPGERAPFPFGRDFAEAVGYPPDLLDTLPATASASFAGVAHLWQCLELQPGQTVIDLGCGAGLDTLIAARQVGPEGQVTGVDFSAEMATLARTNVTAAGVSNVTVSESPVESIPLESGSLDAALANGIFNLSPEKERVVAEIARLLRPGGHLNAAEIVLTEDIPYGERATLDDWFR